MTLVIAILYTVSLTFVFLFSLGQFHLAWIYSRRKKSLNANPVKPAPGEWPLVTVQLPVYNERYVVERLIDNIVKLDYPLDKLQIQVLDDSTDITAELVKGKVANYQEQGIRISQVRRPDRKGYKAGALQYGLDEAEGEFIAIFDADFLPGKDFLKSMIPEFLQPEIGMVQARWGHLNEDYSPITRLQAFGLDAHFTVEQSGRQSAGSFINFNGTGGVWRKKCILDAGGWSAETLTEDLDLSYRAQMKGWQFRYLEMVQAPAELPVVVSAVKSQQYRWNKGAAENVRKNLRQVLAAPLKAGQKIHALFHLSGSSVFAFLLMAAVLSIPLMHLKTGNLSLQLLFRWNGIFVIGFAAISWFYWISTRSSHPQGSLKYYLLNYPLFLAFSMGLSFHNGMAVLEGLSGRRTAFIRTPKFNISSANAQIRGNIYLQQKPNPGTILEGLLALYFLFGVYSAFLLSDYGLILFHAMLFTGFSGVFLLSVFQFGHARR